MGIGEMLIMMLIVGFTTAIPIAIVVALVAAWRTNHRQHEEQVRLLRDIADSLERMNMRVEALEVLLPREDRKEAVQ